MNRGFVVALLGGLIVASGVAHADPAPVKLRGTIDAANPNGIDLTTRAGDKVHVTLFPKTHYAALSQGSVADIKPNSYIGSAALPQADGTLKALEVSVFPEEMRGTGEGQFPWDTAPSSSMTNGVVGTLAGSDGHTMTVRYGTGEAKIVIAHDTPVVKVEAADSAAVVAGAKAFVVAMPGADGAMTALFVAVGKDGVTPPM